MFIKQEVEPTLKEKLKHFVFDVVGCCQDVHREQGPELTEYVYQDSLKIAFEQAQIKFVKEYFFHPTFRGKELPSRLFVISFARIRFFWNARLLRRLVNTSASNSGITCGVQVFALASYTTFPLS